MFVRVVVVLIATTSAAQADREGRITLTQGIMDGHEGATADAVFVDGSTWGPEIARDGLCTLRARVPKSGLSAGTISISGTTQPLLLGETLKIRDVTYKLDQHAPISVFTDGAELTVHAAGGADVPAFTATVTAPSKLEGYRPPASLSRLGTLFEWTPGSGSEVMIVIAALDDARRNPMFLQCRVGDVGHFVVPKSTFALLPTTHHTAITFVARVAETQQMAGDVRITVDAVSAIGAGPIPFEQPRPPPPPPEPIPSPYFQLGYGLGGTSRLGDIPPTTGTLWSLQLGYRLSRTLHVVGEITSLSSGYPSTTAPFSTEERTSAGVGVRWTPFVDHTHRGNPIPVRGFPGRIADAVSTFSLQAIAGLAGRDHQTETAPGVFTDDTSVSPMIDLAVGAGAFRGRDWLLSEEFHEQLEYFAGHVERQWQLIIAIRLF